MLVRCRKIHRFNDTSQNFRRFLLRTIFIEPLENFPSFKGRQRKQLLLNSRRRFILKGCDTRRSATTVFCFPCAATERTPISGRDTIARLNSHQSSNDFQARKETRTPKTPNHFHERCMRERSLSPPPRRYVDDAPNGNAMIP